MSDFLGMDLARAETFCDLLDDQAKAAQHALETVQTCFGDLPWFGEDGDAFREAWIALQKRIVTAIEAMRAKAKAMREQIQEQRAASTARMGSVASMIGGASRTVPAASSQ